MKQFERNLNILFGGMMVCENDPGFGFQIFRLKDDEENARIFRVPRQKSKAANDQVPPTKGTFVLVTMHPIHRQFQLSYCSFPKGSDGSKYHVHGALCYGDFEISKGCKHVVDFMLHGKVPEADKVTA